MSSEWLDVQLVAMVFGTWGIESFRQSSSHLNYCAGVGRTEAPAIQADLESCDSYVVDQSPAASKSRNVRPKSGQPPSLEG